VLSHNGNIGCRTGDVDSDRVPLLVLDVDAKAGGLDALATWEAGYGRIAGWRVNTGSGGLHIYMRGAVGQRSCRLPVLGTSLEVELKANTSYVVSADSTHENGRRYEAESPDGLAALPDAPAWLVELARGDRCAAGSTSTRHGGRVWPTGGFYDVPAAVYVEALTGQRVRGGRALCPLHEDHRPSLILYEDRSWYCPVCRVAGRIVQLAAIVLRVGRQAGARWDLDSLERQQAQELLGTLFPGARS
jgi:hypothetical protein